MSGFSSTSVAPTYHYYGRKQELKYLLKFLKKPEKKSPSLLIVEGNAGIGKTSLIQKSLDLKKEEKAFILYGKYEEQRENIPYYAFRQAFREWANQILLLSDDDYNELKENATGALQTNISAVTGIFNELEGFFSRKQLSLSQGYKADPQQIKARLFYFIKKFFRSITELGYRLIIFLDDVQWADKASILLLQDLLHSEIPNIEVIAACRPSEEVTPQSKRIEELKILKNTSLLYLKPLSRKSLVEFIPTQWNFSSENQDAFTNYLWLETKGNPLRISEIIKKVQRDHLIEKQAEERPDFWQNLPVGRKEGETFKFLDNDFSSLPGKLRSVLSLASCLGFSFKQEVLLAVSEYSEREIEESLLQLIDYEFIIRKDKNYIFSHDSIFSSANALMTTEEKTRIHYTVFSHLLQNLQSYNQTGIFQAVNHLNKALQFSGKSDLVQSEHILLNIQAARLAVKTSAFEIANNYYRFAEELIDKGNYDTIEIKDPLLIFGFETDTLHLEQLQFYVYFGLAETGFLMQQFEEAISYCDRILLLKATRHQRILATIIKMQICSAIIYQKNIRHILLDGLSSLELILSEFGIIFPEDKDELLKEAAEDCKLLYQKTIDYHEEKDFIKLLNPTREYQDLLKLIMTSMTFLYYMDVRKNLYIAIKTLLMCLQNGYSSMAPVLFSASFLTSSFSEENRKLAHLLGKLSLKMIEKEPFQRYSHVVYYIATLNFYAWENHYNECIKKLKFSVQFANEAGDPHYASFCSTNIRLLNAYRGMNLQEHLKFSKELEKNHHIFFISSSDNDLANYFTGIKPGFEENNFQFSEDLIKESEYNMSSRYHLQLALQKLYYISGNNEDALRAGSICENLETVYRGFQIELEHYFFYSLSLLRKAFRDNSFFMEALKIVTPKLEEFRRLSTYKSGNYYHKVLLLEAEIAKCRGNFEEATLLYEKALEEARRQGFIHHAAIAAELAFEYYFFKGRDGFSRTYFKKAIKYYTRWGALAKVRQLNKKFPSLINTIPAKEKAVFSAGEYELIKEIISKTIPGQKISLPELGAFIISKLTSQVKADKGVILTLQDNSWRVLAIHNLNTSFLKKSLKVLEEELPVKLINYCINRGEKITSKEMFDAAPFADDSYIKKEKPESISVFPVRQNSEIIGLIYLENTIVGTDREKELFSVIAELACTTLANAIYYENNDLLNRELKLQERKKIEAVIETQEKERQRIAAELHDSLGQMLALTKINVSRLQPQRFNFDREAEMLISGVSNLIDESCEEVRTISHNLMPPEINDRNLEEILEQLIKKSFETSSITYSYKAERISENITAAFKLTLYRILQEIVQNIIKHASASLVTINLNQSHDFINLVVEDNGKGFDRNLVNMGLGLKNIHSRIKLLNGYLDVDSSINNGTIFNVSIPLKP